MHNILDNEKEINRIDKKYMCHEIIHLPEQVLLGYENKKIELSDEFDISKETIKRVIICTDVADAFPAEIVQVAYKDSLKIDVVNFGEIGRLDKNDLVIVVDYFGNNEQIEKYAKKAEESNCKLATISSEISKDELRKDCINIKLPSGLLSRMAVAYTFTAIIRTLEIYKTISSQALIIKSVIANLISKAGALAAQVSSDINFAKMSAIQIGDKIPFVISENPKFNILAKRWKTQFNINAKRLAFYSNSSQVQSSDIYAMNGKDFDKFMPIFLKRFEEAKSYQKHTKNCIDILNKKNIDYLEFYLEGTDIISEFFSMIYLGDMISCYLAIISDIDPSM